MSPSPAVQRVLSQFTVSELKVLKLLVSHRGRLSKDLWLMLLRYKRRLPKMKEGIFKNLPKLTYKSSMFTLSYHFILPISSFRLYNYCPYYFLLRPMLFIL